jgi:hypothetical protein
VPKDPACAPPSLDRAHAALGGVGTAITNDHWLCGGVDHA